MAAMLAVALALCAPTVVASDSIFIYSAVMIDGSGPVSLAQYRGNVTVVVNVAT